MVPEMLLHLGIEVKINIAEEKVMGPMLLGFKKESCLVDSNNVESPAVEMGRERILVDFGNSFL